MSGIFKLRRRAVAAFFVLMLVMGGALAPAVVRAEQVAGQSFPIRDFCADRSGMFPKLMAAIDRSLRSMGMPKTDRLHDDAMVFALERVIGHCDSGKAERGVPMNLGLYVHNSIIDARRMDKGLEFREEIGELVPEESRAISYDEVFDVVREKASDRQTMIFLMLSEGMPAEDIAGRLGIGLGPYYRERTRLFEMLREEFHVPEKVARAKEKPSATASGTTMMRVQSPLGAEIYAALKKGAQVSPIGLVHAGPVMTVKVPSAQLSGPAVEGIMELPVPVILQSDTAGEQEMVVSAAREIGEGDPDFRTFALYAFCKDEDLETPGDSSRYSFKAEVDDPMVTEIVSRGDLQQPEKISERLWDYYAAH